MHPSVTTHQIWVGFYSEQPIVLVRRQRVGIPNLHQPTLLTEYEGDGPDSMQYYQERAAQLRPDTEWQSVRILWGENYPGLQPNRVLCGGR